MIKRVIVAILAVIGIVAIIMTFSYMFLIGSPVNLFNKIADSAGRSNFASMQEGAPAFGANRMSFAQLPASKMLAGDAIGGQAADTTSKRMIIKRVYVDLLVKDPAGAISKAADLTQKLGGFVVSSSLRNADEKGPQPQLNRVVRATITFRVPTAQLDQALAGLRSIAVRVISENITGQDITADYIDQQSRLNNLKAAESKLKEIMDKATRSRDVIAAYKEIVDIRGQIDRVEGRIKYYKESVDLSSVTVNFKSEEKQPFVNVAEWQIKTTIKNAFISLINALNSLFVFALRFFIIYLSVIILCCIPLALIVWIVRVLRRK
jgi:hypothetical protein